MHVGMDAAALDARGLPVASTFLTRAEAEAAGSNALSQNAGQISIRLQGGAATNLKLTTPFTGGLVRVARGYEATATSARELGWHHDRALRRLTKEQDPVGSGVSLS